MLLLFLSHCASMCRYTKRSGAKLNMIYLLVVSICGLATATHTFICYVIRHVLVVHPPFLVLLLCCPSLLWMFVSFFLSFLCSAAHYIDALHELVFPWNPFSITMKLLRCTPNGIECHQFNKTSTTGIDHPNMGSLSLCFNSPSRSHRQRCRRRRRQRLQWKR